MKKLNLISIAILMLGFVTISFAKPPGKTKLQKFEDIAQKMNDKGIFSAVGSAVMSVSRSDNGRDAAIAKARNEMALSKEFYNKSTLRKFQQAIGVDKNAEFNDLLTTIIEQATEALIQNCQVLRTTQFQDKYNKKDKTYQHVALVYIDPQNLYTSIEDELKNKDKERVYYQRYMESEAKKEHDKLINDLQDFRKEAEKIK